MTLSAYEEIYSVISSKADQLSKTQRDSLITLIGGFDGLDTSHPTYLIIVDYSKTIEKLIEEGGYGWCNDDISSENFPSSKKGIVSIEISLLRFDRPVNGDYVISEMNRQGLRPATLKELLTFRLARPQIEPNERIVALGSRFRDYDNDTCVPFINFSYTESCDLMLCLWQGAWPQTWMFAAVRK